LDMRVLRACSAAPIQLVTRRHQTTQESADTRTGRHRLTLRNIDQHKISGLLIRRSVQTKQSSTISRTRGAVCDFA
jgi:hypothetical protein